MATTCRRRARSPMLPEQLALPEAPTSPGETPPPPAELPRDSSALLLGEKTLQFPVGADLAAAFEALDRLNGYVRSEAHREHGFLSGPRRAIYEMKQQAILVAHKAGIATHRRVFVH